MIIDQNTKLVLPKGIMVALITEDGDILKKGTEIELEIFSAIQKEVFSQVFSGSVTN
ncbi:hypothetical protein [Thalassotalea agariperforans]